jgi:hypothetical protein
VLSSGIHGVEGYFGSAVQLQTLRAWAKARPAHRFVMIHALNPYGMAWRRRVNEDNVDLNRNFLGEGERYEGRPDGYAQFDALLNPRAAPSPWEPLRLKFALAIVRHGMARVQHIVTSGQYEYPKGLFFGGRAPTRSLQILQQNFARWLGDAKQILHVDFHTGLGRPATYQMLVDHPLPAQLARRLEGIYGSDVVRAIGPGSVSANLRGSFGLWAHRQLADRDFAYAAAEFGTCSALEVVTALRIENQCVHWAAPDAPVTERAKRRLLEAFCPSSPQWRRQVLARGAKIVEQAVQGLA